MNSSDISITHFVKTPKNELHTENRDDERKAERKGKIQRGSGTGRKAEMDGEAG